MIILVMGLIPKLDYKVWPTLAAWGAVIILSASGAWAVPSPEAPGDLPPQGSQGPFLGALTEAVHPVDRIALGIEAGVRVLSVVEGGPAWGKLKAGDLVTAIDGRPVTSPQSFVELGVALGLGRNVSVLVMRGGEVLEVEITTSPRSSIMSRDTNGATALVGDAYVKIDYPSERAASTSSRPSTPETPSGAGFLGVSVQDNPRYQEQVDNGLPGGALVRNVLPGSAAQSAGIAVGDIITWVQGKPVEGASDLTRAVSGFDAGTQVKLVVMRRASQLTLTATLQAKP